jgi:hypothetical protein
MSIRITFTICLLAICVVSLAQNKLLFHKNRYREAFYTVGDNLAFRIKGQKEKISGTITAIDDTVFTVNGERYNPSRIDRLYIDPETRMWFAFRYKWERLFLIGGIGYLVIDWINAGNVSEETLIISGSLVAAGLLARWLIPWHINVKKHRRMVILRDPKTFGR